MSGELRSGSAGPGIGYSRVLQVLTRKVSESLARCELTHLARKPIDLGRARAQHGAYELALQRLGCRVERLPEEAELPDAVFVEDVALVLDEVAILLRPGAASRRPEVDSVGRALRRHRRVLDLGGAGTLDGGDILLLDRVLHVGRSSRSSAEGAGALRERVAPFGYEVREVPVRGCLHLKSAVTRIAGDLLLVQPAWVDARAFPGWRVVDVDPGEPHAANALRIGERLVFPEAFPKTAARLESAGLRLERVDLSELAKAEGAVTCCSLVFEA